MACMLTYRENTHTHKIVFSNSFSECGPTFTAHDTIGVALGALGFVWSERESLKGCAQSTALPSTLELIARHKLCVRRPHPTPDLQSCDYKLFASREGILCSL